MFNNNFLLRFKNLFGNKFEYVANNRKLLNDGLSNPKQYVKEQFQRIFKNNKSLLASLKINNKAQFIRLVNDNSSILYNFIKVF